MRSFLLTKISRLLQSPKRGPISRLFLLGIEGQLSQNYAKPYNYYLNVFKLILFLGVLKWLRNIKKLEMDVQSNAWFVPQYILKVREESHMYWEIVRVASGLPATFTYYKWDQNLMFEIDRQGKQTPFQSHRGLESTDTFASPLHEYNYPASAQKHSQILLYLKNLNNPYDLKNHLRKKPVNMGDWLRTIYFFVYRELGLSNRWRYDQFVSKPDIVYRWEKIKLVFSLSRDRTMLYSVIDRMDLGLGDLRTYFIWFM